jgi:tetratricopeptide (TPR) repeat protein
MRWTFSLTRTLVAALVICSIAFTTAEASAGRKKGKGKGKGKAAIGKTVNGKAAIGKTAEANSKALAQQQFQAGQKHYRLGNFKEALDAYVAAYDLFPVAGLLFNIGQCQMELENYERAVFFFDQYLTEKPYAPNVDVVEERLAEAHQELKKVAQRKADDLRRAEETARLEQQRKDEALRREEDEARQEREARRREAEDRRRAEEQARLAAITAGSVGGVRVRDERGVFEKASMPTLTLWGVGAAGAATFTYFGLKARSHYARATDPTFQGAQRESESGKSAQMLANISLAAAVVSGASGVLFYMVSDSESPPQVALLPTRDGGLVAASFSF